MGRAPSHSCCLSEDSINNVWGALPSRIWTMVKAFDWDTTDSHVTEIQHHLGQWLKLYGLSNGMYYHLSTGKINRNFATIHRSIMGWYQTSMYFWPIFQGINPRRMVNPCHHGFGHGYLRWVRRIAPSGGPKWVHVPSTWSHEPCQQEPIYWRYLPYS